MTTISLYVTESRCVCSVYTILSMHVCMEVRGQPRMSSSGASSWVFLFRSAFEILKLVSQ